jgi:hypothetical protein
MQFGSRANRNIVIQYLVLLIPEVALAAVIAHYLELGTAGFLIVLPALLLLYIVLWIKNSLFAWARFLLFGRRLLALSVAEYFRTARFPEPNDYEATPEDYLLRTKDDENQPIGVRIDAAASLSELSTLSTFGFVQASMRVRMVYEDALDAHKAAFKSSQSDWKMS